MDKHEAENRRIGARLRNLREALGVTPADLADIVGVSEQELRAYEGGGALSAPTLRALAAALDVGADELLDAPGRPDARLKAAQDAHDYVAAIADPRLRGAALAMLSSLALRG